MNVLSLFDGISCGQLALTRANIKIDKYFSSEIKNYAIKVTQHNFPNTIQLGDIKNIHSSDLPKIDLLIGGSPCQNLSRGRAIHKKNIDGLNGDRSSLFYEYVRLLKECKPKYFLLENVVMSQTDENIISEIVGVKPIQIDSSLVSYQKRKRNYWTNIPNIIQPHDKNINFQDYKDSDYEYCKLFKLNRTTSREKMWGNGHGDCPNITHKSKINCITTKQDRWKNSGLIEFDGFSRFLTTRELELGQTLPIGYTNVLSKNQAENVIGDGWTVDVISHIFSFLPDEYKI